MVIGFSHPSFDKKPRPIIRLVLIISLLIALFLFAPSSHAQQDEADLDRVVERIFQSLTPAERVGQLFMVDYQGPDVSVESNIGQLIQRYRVGGVYLSARRQNFTNSLQTPSQVLSITNALQRLPFQPTSAPQLTPTITSTFRSPIPITPTTVPQSPAIPLFIAVEHDGDGYPHSQIRGGLTELPSQMTLGATWQPEYAASVGEVVGRELSALGVNMLFGPSLDVLDNPRLDSVDALGVRSFGGHPYWVAQMGKAFVRGVQQGSDGQLLTIAKHFPGFGSSQRVINQELPIILKSLTDLRQTELAPFFALTRPDSDIVVDGLLTSHIRYQGLRGSVPISIDTLNLPNLLALDELAEWRNNGGLIVSAPLGAPAALDSIAQNQQTFPARRLVQDGLFADNDILFAADFSFDNDPEQAYDNLRDAILFAQLSYSNDPRFRTNVNRAVRRILKAKVHLFGPELLDRPPLNSTDNLTALDPTDFDTAQIVQAGATLLIPFDEPFALPDPAQASDNIIIFTDGRTGQDCPICPEFPLLTQDGLEQAILQRFGPTTTRQTGPNQIRSYTLANLSPLLAEDSRRFSTVENALRQAEWVVFVLLDIAPTHHPHSDALRKLLRTRYEDLRGKNVIVFSLDAPYFLDETEISQLTAYYALYSKGSAALETAARLLFQQVEPDGAAPISIPALGPLDLSPDPSQTIRLRPLQLIDGGGRPSEFSERALNSGVDLEVGEGIRFRTEAIVDRNGNLVPDGTIVNFFREYPQEWLGLFLAPQISTTLGGVAEIIILKELDSPLRITVSSGLAERAYPFDIGPGFLDTPTPTPTPSPTPTFPPTHTSTPSPTASETATAVPPTPTFTPAPSATPSPPSTPGPMRPPTVRPPVVWSDFFVTFVGSILVGLIGFAAAGDMFSLEERIRPLLVAIAFGLTSYVLYTIFALLWPANAVIMQISQGVLRVPLITLLCAAFSVGMWYLKPGRIFALEKLRWIVTRLERKDDDR